MARSKSGVSSEAKREGTKGKRRPDSGGMRPIVLPPPDKDGGKSVLAALRSRRTNRNIGPFGKTGRTAGSASNAQEVDIYVALAEGTYLYKAVGHRLVPVAARDLPKLSISRGQRTMLGQAPVHLLYVADIARYRTAGFQEPGLWDAEIQKSYSNVAVGLIAGNVDLFAASAGLGSWFHNCDKQALASALSLRPEQRALYGHTVGYPSGGGRKPLKRPKRTR